MPDIPRAVCGRCLVAMRPHKTGQLIEAMTRMDGENLHPYYKVQADEYRCPACGYTAFVAFAQEPVAEHYMAHYSTIPSGPRFTWAPYKIGE
jgi:ribosomal protein S27AE